MRTSEIAARLMGLAVLGMVFTLMSCSTVSLVPVDRDLAHLSPSSNRAQGIRTSGYVTNDGRYHGYDGWAVVVGDTLALYRDYPPYEGKRTGPQRKLPVDQVTTLFEQRISLGRTAGLGAAAATVGAALLLLYVVAWYSVHPS